MTPIKNPEIIKALLETAVMEAKEAEFMLGHFRCYPDIFRIFSQLPGVTYTHYDDRTEFHYGNSWIATVRRTPVLEKYGYAIPQNYTYFELETFLD
jgi:hypothetical protein